MTGPIRLVVSDVDGTLVTPDKVLTARTVGAVARLGEAGIRFAVTSGRPPRGMAMLVEPLSITTPICGFNGGLVVDPAMHVLRERRLPGRVVAPVLAALRAHGLEVWLFHGVDWLVVDRHGAHVDREVHACQFEPTVVASVDGVTDRVAKVVGVSDDPEAIAAATAAVLAVSGRRVSATSSQPYYLDVTHPDANKGTVVGYLSTTLGVASEEIATIGDSANDVSMFERSGLSIAMGNASDAVRAAATHTTGANDRDGFADAMERLVLGD